MVEKKPSSSFKYLNVIMHGVYAYLWNYKKGMLNTFSPAVCEHVYSARNYGATLPPRRADAHSVPILGDYHLEGVHRGKKFKLVANTPCIPSNLSKISRCDFFEKRMLRIDFPFPTGDDSRTSKPYHLVESFSVGSIFQGLAGPPLNAVGNKFPSLLCFVYKINKDEELALVPNKIQRALRSGEEEPVSIPLDFLLTRDGYANLHIMAGLDPAIPMPGDGRDHDHAPHARRAFAALVDLFDELPLTLEIPDGFAPQKFPITPLPGILPGDIESADSNQPGVLYGRANCHSATFVINMSK